MEENKKITVDPRELVKAGVHFGHQTTRWCPKMAPYIWGIKNNVHLIDVSKTATQLEKAAQFIHDVAAQGKSILWVGTKKAARTIIFDAANRIQMPFVFHRWIGGTLTNKDQVKKSVTKLLHYEDVLAKSAQFTHYTKKEFTLFQKMVDRLTKNVGGIKELGWPVGAIVLVDVEKEASALKEAAVVGVPVIGLVDTNSDPSGVDIVIPGNDDAPKSIKIIIDVLANAAAQGKEIALAKKAQVRAAAQIADEAAGKQGRSEEAEKTLALFEQELATDKGGDAKRPVQQRRPMRGGPARGGNNRAFAPRKPTKAE